MNRNLKFAFYAGGIFLAYFYYGILQEKVTKGKYAEETIDEHGVKSVVYEKYTYFLSLVFIQCLLSFIVAKVEVALKRNDEEKSHNELLFCGTALTYVLAMVCSNMALQWVAYPTQVVGKSAKPIPVLLLGVLIGRKSYPWRKYLFVFLVVVGVVLFMFKDKGGAGSQVETSFGFGEILLLLSLTMDGLTGAMQEIMRSTTKPSGELMMMHMNFWSCVFLTVGLVGSGEVFQFVRFVARHPYVLTNILLLASAGSVGQHFIYLMVSGFGPLPLSIVTTIRKFVTVLASVLIFGNSLMPRQWFGTVLVFGALFLDAYYSKSAAPKKKETS